MKLRMLSAALMFAALSLTTASAQVYDPKTGDPPSAQHIHFTTNEWTVTATPDGGDLSGDCRLDCYTDEYDQVFLRLKGLKSTGTYTVWMVNRDKDGGEERAGVAKHWNGDDANRFDFTAEASGKGFYNGWLARCPLGRWKTLEVRYHPNGNVKDMESSVVVLRVRVKPL